MKFQKVLFPYIFLFSLSIYSQNKLVSSFSDYYDNGCKCQIFGIGKKDLNGLKQEKWELLNKKNNSPYGEGNYVNDKKNGEWIYFFSSSRSVNLRINYVKGKRVGKYYEYDIEGNIIHEGNFNNEGKLDGTQELISSHSIKDDKTKLIGEWEFRIEEPTGYVNPILEKNKSKDTTLKYWKFDKEGFAFTDFGSGQIMGGKFTDPQTGKKVSIRYEINSGTEYYNLDIIIYNEETQPMSEISRMRSLVNFIDNNNIELQMGNNPLIRPNKFYPEAKFVYKRKK
jgi:hypothetical protein